MTKNEMLEHIRDKFSAALNQKTGLGKNEILKIYDSCVKEVITRSLDERTDKKIRKND